MPQSETSFLLSILNTEFRAGRLEDGETNSLLQSKIIHRLFSLGLWAEFHPDRELWYAHVNDETGKWEE